MGAQEFFSSGLEAIRAYEKETGADHGVLYRSLSETVIGEYAALYPLGEDGTREMLTPSGRIPARSGHYIRWDWRPDAYEEIGRIENLLGIVAEEEAERKEKRLPRVVADGYTGRYILADWPAPPEGVKVLKGRYKAEPPLPTQSGPVGGRKAEEYICVEGLRPLARILDRPEYRHTILLLRALAACPDAQFREDLIAGEIAYRAPQHFPMKGATKDYGTVPVPELIRHLGRPGILGRLLAEHGRLDEERKHAEG